MAEYIIYRRTKMTAKCDLMRGCYYLDPKIYKWNFKLHYFQVLDLRRGHDFTKNLNATFFRLLSHSNFKHRLIKLRISKIYILPMKRTTPYLVHFPSFRRGLTSRHLCTRFYKEIHLATSIYAASALTCTSQSPLR